MSGNDWIEWHGGDCPVADNTTVEVSYRGGIGTIESSAWRFSWSHKISGSDIIKYRIVGDAK